MNVDPSGEMPSWVQNEWNYLKSVHSSWESALSYWTLGFTDPIFAVYRNPITSKEYWIAFSQIYFNTFAFEYRGESIGAEAVIKRTGEAAVDLHKLNHIFGKADHNLNGFLSKYGGDQIKAFNDIKNATQKYIDINKVTGTFKDIVVNVNGIDITVRGAVIDGEVKLGTAFIP